MGQFGGKLRNGDKDYLEAGRKHGLRDIRHVVVPCEIC